MNCHIFLHINENNKIYERILFLILFSIAVSDVQNGSPTEDHEISTPGIAKNSRCTSF